MRDSEKNAFKAAMDTLRTRYGAFFGGDPEWKQRLAAYFEQLRRHDLRDVTTAIERAPTPDYHPDRFPTAGQLQRLVIVVELERKQSASAAAHARDEQSEDERLREEFSLIPIGAQAQADYIAAATTPFDRLAREWQCESKRLGLDPTKPSPPDVSERRMREFWALWGSYTPRTAPTPHYRRTQVIASPTRSREPGEDDVGDQEKPQQRDEALAGESAA